MKRISIGIRIGVRIRVGICGSNKRPLPLTAFPSMPRHCPHSSYSRSLPRPVDLDVEPIFPFRCKQFTITTGTPSALKPEQVLGEIRHVTDSGQFEELGKDLPNQNKTVVILSTPSFTRWLQNDHHFIADVLKTIFPSRQGLPASDSDATEVQTILAVVDGLCPSALLSDEPQTAEGFSIMVCVGESRIPGYDRKDLVDPGHPETTQIPNITFHLYNGGSVKNTKTFIDVSMPLANTLFHNGRASTLFLGRWKRSPSDHIFHQIENSDKQSCTIPTDCSRLRLGPMKLGVDRKPLLTPLTVPRRIASGLGNIVRQLADADGKLLPASVELEKSVVSFLESKNLPQQTVSVWAWIIPAYLFPSKRQVGLWESLRKGAGLHRVLSGGGGWGVKAGLLSLDPSTTLSSSTEAHFDFSNVEAGLVTDDAQRRALGDVAKPGSFIQFLIAEPRNEPIQAGTPSSADDPSDKPVTRILSPSPMIRLGCIRSTIDDMPSTSSEISNDNADAKLTVSMDHFSAESEMGLFLRIKETVTVKKGEKCLKTHYVKVDVPGFSIIGTELKDFKIDRREIKDEKSKFLGVRRILLDERRQEPREEPGISSFLGVRRILIDERRQNPREEHGISNFLVRKVQSVGGEPGSRTVLLEKDEEICAVNLQNAQDQRKTEN